MTRSLRLLKVKAQTEPGTSKIKRIEFEGFNSAVRMGIHAGFSEFFGIVPEEPLPSTLDYVVAAVGGCLTGTLAGALAKRGIEADASKLVAEVEGQLEEVDGKLLLTDISVLYRLKVPKEKRAAAERALEHHDSVCPVSASVRRGITVHWKSEIEEH
jgi:uncharacterized OsmC-like protein